MPNSTQDLKVKKIDWEEKARKFRDTKSSFTPNKKKIANKGELNLDNALSSMRDSGKNKSAIDQNDY